MRVLVTAAPFRGHLNTVLPLARAAQRAGHEVVVATGADLARAAESVGLATWPSGKSGAEEGAPRSIDHFWHAAEARLADLLPRTDDWAPEVVLAEELELAGPVVAARSGARLLVHGLGIAAAGDPAAYASDLDELGRHWDVSDLSQRHSEAPYLSICPPSLAPRQAARRETVPIRPGSGEPAPGERLPEELDALPYDDTVHLTLGTVFHRLRPHAMATAIDALSGLPANLVVTVGPGVAPESFGPQPPHVLLASYLPHSLLLPRCRLVVSQGGAGILLGALAHGLPQLVLPQAADQFANAAAVVEAGAGVALDDPDVTGEQIADAARELLRAPAYADAAGLVGAEIAAMPSADEVVAALL